MLTCIKIISNTHDVFCPEHMSFHTFMNYVNSEPKDPLVEYDTWFKMCINAMNVYSFFIYSFIGKWLNDIL